MQGKPWTGDGPRILMAYFLHFIYSYWASTGGTLKSLGFYPAPWSLGGNRRGNVLSKALVYKSKVR